MMELVTEYLMGLGPLGVFALVVVLALPVAVIVAVLDILYLRWRGGGEHG